MELKRASKLAVKEGFVFRCKFLEGGKILEPMPEEFFERAERAERQKDAKRAERDARKAGDGDRPAGYGRRPDAAAGRAPYRSPDANAGRTPDRRPARREDRITHYPLHEKRERRGKDGDGTRS